VTTWKNRIVGTGEEDPTQLLAHPNNWRVHPQAQREALAGVMRDVGWVQQVIVNRQTGHLIDGHLRVDEAMRNDEPLVPVVYVDLDPSEEAEVLLTLDPLAGMAHAAKESMDALLRDVSTGEASVQSLLSDLAAEHGLTYGDDGDEPEAPEAQIDRAEELREQWGTALGQVWEVGRHRVMCGDSTSAEDVAVLLGGKRADVVFTDPPYGMDLDADFSGMVGIGKGKKYENVIGDQEPYDPMHIFRDFGYCNEIFLWGADYYAERIPDRVAGSWVVWDKVGVEGPNDNYDKMFGSNFELCWSKARHKRALVRVTWKGIFGLAAEDTKTRIHPTQKPAKLAGWFLERFCPNDGLVVDLFIGSGFTIVAAEQLDRTCYGMEIEPKYVAVTLQRLADMGLEPSLVEK